MLMLPNETIQRTSVLFAPMRSLKYAASRIAFPMYQRETYAIAVTHPSTVLTSLPRGNFWGLLLFFSLCDKISQKEWCFLCEVLFSLWGIVYAATILSALFSLLQVRKCLQKLNRFLTEFNCGSNHDKSLDSLLKYYPVITKYASSPNLNYQIPDLENYFRSEQLHSKLMMTRNFKKHALIRSLNPLVSLKAIAKFPVTAISWLGFKPGKATSLFISILGWLIAYILSLFSEEIKALIVSLFERFAYT